MTVDRERLLRDEEEGWARFRAAVAAVPPARAEEPTVTPDGWSPKDTIFHVAAWLDLCADVIGRIVDGTWDPSTAEEEDPAFVERTNAEQFERARAMTPREVEASLARARERAREAFASMPEVTPDAWGWFEESGPMHYAKHVHDLAAFAAGTAPDPEVGPLLQAETDGWLELV
ncbi:MAG TPA: maleylpyruvate isomerase N-terminal domain-containing protein, partial [Actinomycetota bacterium]